MLLVVVDDEFDPGFAGRDMERFDSTVVVGAVCHDEKAVKAEGSLVSLNELHPMPGELAGLMEADGGDDRWEQLTFRRAIPDCCCCFDFVPGDIGFRALAVVVITATIWMKYGGQSPIGGTVSSVHSTWL
ncbi:hypothetical protein GCM10009655_12210 [Rhodoglobus aureus]|uniref:Uncharacterized protein n=1 Tax=Rhodoglobus aureus TaxID=191497 RepID=A0ABN1VJV2_9MICO